MTDELNYLKHKLDSLQISLTDVQIAEMLEFKELVLEKNKVMNLTAITEPEKFIDLHIIDSLTILKYIPQTASVIDVGSGAGFPGVILKIAAPGTQVILLDSLKKRTDFLTDSVAKLRLEGVSVLNGRAEEFSKLSDFREKFDIAVSRAVAKLPLLCEYCIPYVKKDGLFVAMKSRSAEEELSQCGNLPEELGCIVEKVENIKLPGLDEERTLISFRKKDTTPPKFPRKNSVLKKLYK